MESRYWEWTGTKVPKLKSKLINKIEDNEVLVRIKAIGICATDLHILQGKANFSSPPYALGHEAAGKVVDIGKSVTKVNVGDRCTLDPSVGCEKCQKCMSGNKHQCSQSQEYGIDMPGFWQEYVVISENNLYKLPESISYAEGSQCETIHVCLGGMDKVKIKPGEKVVIIGDGPTGLFFTRLVKLQGASEIGVIGSRDIRLDIATKYGATETYKYRHSMQYIDEIKKNFDVVIEAVGKKQSIEMSQHLVAKQGRILLFGLPEEKVEFDVMDLILDEISLFGSANAPRVWTRVIELLKGKQINISPMITHRFPYEKLDQAVDFAFSNDQNAVKVIVENK